MKRLFIIFILLFFAGMSVINAQDNTSSLEDIYHALKTIDNLELRGVLSIQEALAQE